MYLSLYLKDFVCEVESEQRMQHIDLPSPSRHRRVLFSFSWAAQPGAWGPSLSGTCSHSSIFSPTGLQTHWEVLRVPSAGWWLSLPHLGSNFTDLQLTDFLSSLSYIIVQSPTQYLFSWLARPEYATSGVFGLACLIIIKWK